MAILTLSMLSIPTSFVLAQEASAPQLSRNYRGIELDMPPEQVQNLLLADPWFEYRGDASVSLLERPRASVIDAGGSLFISRGLFQFEEEALAAIILELNPEKIDWYTMYRTLENKYGPPVELNPEKIWWTDGITRIALERPLTVKYLDLEVFESALEEQEDRRTWYETAREDFIKEF